MFDKITLILFFFCYIIGFTGASSVIKANNEKLECHYPFTELFKYPNDIWVVQCTCNKKVTSFKLNMDINRNPSEGSIELDSSTGALTIIPGNKPVEYKTTITASIEETGERYEIPIYIHPVNVLDLEGVRYNYTEWYSNICQKGPINFIKYWNGTAYVKGWYGYEDAGEFVQIFQGCQDAAMWMNFTWNMTIEEEGDYKFYLSVFDSAVFFVDDIKQIDLFEICLTERTEEAQQIHLTKGLHAMKVNTEGYYWPETKPLSMLIYYSKPNSEAKLSLPAHCDDDTFEPLLELSSPSYNYHFVNNSEIEIELKIKKGYRLTCSSEEPLPKGLHFIWDYFSIKGTTVEEQEEKTYHVSCRNAHSVTNTISITISIGGNIKPGFNAYYIKTEEFAQNCLAIYYPDDKRSTVFVARHENQMNHLPNNETGRFDDLSIDFNGEYSAVWKGYLKIDKKGSYHLKVTFSDTFSVSIGSMCGFSVGHCKSSDVATDICDFKKELYPFTFGYTSNYNKPLFNFTMTLDGVEVIPQFYYETNGVVEYNYSTIMYQVGNEIIPNKLISDKLDIISVSITPVLPDGLMINIITGEISGTPSKVSKMTEYTILINTSDGSYTTTIKIGVEMVNEPSEFYYHDLINDLDLEKGSIYPLNTEMKMEIRYKKGGVSKYLMYEKLPKGFNYTLGNDQLIIFGQADESIHILDFYFKAYSGSIVTVQEFYIKFESIKSEKFSTRGMNVVIVLSLIIVVGLIATVFMLIHENKRNVIKCEENIEVNTKNQPLL